MVVLVLALGVMGAFATSAVLFITGASFGVIALGYVAGGWTAILLGGGLFALWRLFDGRPQLHSLVPAED